MQSAQFVACLTVLPGRVDSARFRSAVETLVLTPEIASVYIFYPRECKRLGQPYPEPPQWLSEREGVHVVRVEDSGPATKFLPLLDILDPASRAGVVLIDDDRLLPEGWLRPLISAYERHGAKAAVGRHGSLQASRPFRYDHFLKAEEEQEDARFLCMKTTFGVIYPRAALPASSAEAQDFIKKYEAQGSWRNDDMMLAGFCYRSKTPMFLVPSSMAELAAMAMLNSEENDAESLSRVSGHVRDQLALATKMVVQGDFPAPWSDIWTISAILVLVLVLIACIFILLR